MGSFCIDHALKLRAATRCISRTENKEVDLRSILGAAVKFGELEAFGNSGNLGGLGEGVMAP